MPMYNITNTETNETTEEAFTSWNALQEHLRANPHLKQGLSTPEFVSQHGSTLSKTSDGWKDHLNAIKKNSGRNNTIKT